jgi:hypothetical protein
MVLENRGEKVTEVKTKQQKTGAGSGLIFMVLLSVVGESKSRIRTRGTCGMDVDRRNAHKILVMESERTRKLTKIIIKYIKCVREPI